MSPDDSQLRALSTTLPFPLAFVLDEYLREDNPFVKLHRLVDAAELVTRFLTMVVLSDLLRERGAFPPELCSLLADKLERPTFGAWKSLLLGACKAQKDERLKGFVPELLPYVDKTLSAALGWGGDEDRTHLIALRNRIAHAGRLSDALAADYLRDHQSRFEDLWLKLGFLNDYSLFACAGDRTAVPLRGAHPAPGAGAPAAPPGLEPQRVYLAAGDRWLDLFPLQAFCEVLQWRDGDLRPVGGPVPQLYYRMSDKGFIEFTPLSDLASFAQLRGSALERFRDCYHLEEWRRLAAVEGRVRAWNFRELRDDLQEVFVGRDAQVRLVKERVRQLDQGILWVTGEPGVGKSALMARLARDFEGDAGRYLTVTYFFRQGHMGCSAGTFVKVASLHLYRALQIAPEDAGREGADAAPLTADRLSQFRQTLQRAAGGGGRTVLFLVDGLDEVYRAEPAVAPLITGSVFSGVVWVCAGRNEPRNLEAALLAGGAEPAFPNGLPRLDEKDVRALLTDQLGPRKYDLFARDEHAAGGEEWRNRLVETLTRQADGLPLYVRLVIDEIREGQWSLERLGELPKGLGPYFDQLLERLGAGDIGQVVQQLFCVLALAKEPGPEGVVASVLVAGEFGKDTPAWRAVFGKAVQAGGLLLRSAPNPEGREGLVLYHDAFRQHLLRSPRHNWTAERAATAWVAYGRGWAGLEDNYPLRHQSAHLFEARDHAGLQELLLKTDFIGVKLRKLGDPFLAADDVRLLTITLVRERRPDDLARLGATDNAYQRDGLVAGLRDAVAEDAAAAATVRDVARRLLRAKARPTLARTLKSVALPWTWFGPGPATQAVLNARLAAFEVASGRADPDLLAEAARDRSDAVRALLIPYLFRFWETNREAGWGLHERLVGRIWGTLPLPRVGALIVAAGMALHILIHHPGDRDLLARLRAAWVPAVQRGRRLVDSTFGMMLKVLARALLWVARTQPDYQPINAVEIRASYRRRRREHDLGLRSLEDLRDPRRGAAETVRILLEEGPGYDVYLMMVAERVLVYHGCHSPATVFPALRELHDRGPDWFRQSALYAGFHLLRHAAAVEESWLDDFVRMNRETWGDSGTFATGNGVYQLSPKLAWLELVFEKHRPRSRPKGLFVAEYYRRARERGDNDQARHLLEACKILALAYRRNRLALENLRPALEDWSPARAQDPAAQRLSESVIQLLAQLRFYDQAGVDAYLEQLGKEELRRRAARTPPRLASSDIATWVDDFMNDRLVASDGFRGEIVDAFESAGHAASMSDLLGKVFSWVMGLIGGKPANTAQPA